MYLAFTGLSQMWFAIIKKDCYMELILLSTPIYTVHSYCHVSKHTQCTRPIDEKNDDSVRANKNTRGCNIPSPTRTDPGLLYVAAWTELSASGRLAGSFHLPTWAQSHPVFKHKPTPHTSLLQTSHQEINTLTDN